MQRLVLAFRCLFAVLFGQVAVDAARQLLEATSSEEVAARTPGDSKKEPGDSGNEPGKIASRTPRATAQKAKPARSEALTLLAALQRESRFLDIVNEPLGDYSDQQIGAAARDVLRDAAAVLKRMFDLQPVVDQADGSALEVPPNYDPATYRLSGQVTGEPPFEGTLVHHGWRATRCELPEWSGSSGTVRVVAPAEVEVSGE